MVGMGYPFSSAQINSAGLRYCMVAILSLILLFSLPFQFAIPIGAEWDIPLARGIAAAMGIIFLATAFIRRAWQLPAPLMTGMVISFLGLALAGCLWATRPELAIPKIVLFFNLFPLIFIWYDLFWRKASARIQLIRALLYGAIGSAVIGLILFIAQFVFGVGETFHFLVDQVLPFFLGKELAALVASYPSLLVNINGETILRLSTFFPDPHVAAYFYGMCGFLALGMARLGGDTQYRYIWMAGILFLVDLLTFSRGGYIGLLMGMGVYSFLIVPKLTSPSRLWVGGLALLFFLALLMFGQPVLSRLAATFSLADASNLERISLWRESFDAVAHRPLLGVGLGNYIATVRPLYAVGTPFYAHNLYLDISLEMGLLGLIAFLGICLYALSCVLKLRHGDPLAPALLGVFALYLTHSFFETTLYSLHITLVFSFVVALALSSKQSVSRITQ